MGTQSPRPRLRLGLRGMQIMGGECATDVIVNVRRGPHSKLPRSRCAAASGAVASSLVRHLGGYIHVWKWPVKASTQGNGLWLCW